MSRRPFSSVSSLIADLLDRHERNPNAVRLLSSINNDGFASIDERDAFDDALASLEREGGVELVRTGHRTERLISAVRLKDPAVLYRRAGRRPSGLLADDALAALRVHDDLPIGAGPLIDAVATAWSRGVSHLGIAKGDVQALGHVIRLAAAVHARMIEAPKGEIDFRTFSRFAVTDSKALERNIRQVASVVSRLFPLDGTRIGLKPDELLANAGIVRLPQPVLIRGLIAVNGQTFPDLSFVGVPTEYAEIIDLKARPTYILTIENYVSFVRHVREIGRADSGLVIYSGGFPSRPTLKAIVRLAAQADAPTYHWGDMDPGGVRIFRYIERHLAPLGVTLRPHMMDADLLRQVGTVAADMTDVVGDMMESVIANLARTIRETGLVHEQEEFSPRSPLEDSPVAGEKRAINTGPEAREAVVA